MTVFKRMWWERFWRKLGRALESAEPEEDRDDDRYDPFKYSPFKGKGPYRGRWFGPKYGRRK